MKTEKRKFGDFGEAIARKFLMKHGFAIIEQNYLRPWGEIDLIGKKNGDTHFVEVKSALRRNLDDVNHETIRPEENIHSKKLRRMHRAAQTYCIEHSINQEDIHLDAVIVLIKEDYKKTRVTYWRDLVL